MQRQTVGTETSGKLRPKLRRTFHYERFESDEPVLIVEQRSVELDEKFKHLVPTLVVTSLRGMLWVAAEDSAESVHERFVGFSVKEKLLDLTRPIQEGK